MVYSVEIAPAAERKIRKLSRQTQSAIFECLSALRSNPRPHGFAKLAGSGRTGKEARYRLRVGDYRVIYSIRDKNLIVIIIRVAHRKEAYR